MSPDRRTFIKYASGVLGGSLLAACGVETSPTADRDVGGDVQLPNGYRFHAVKRDGDALPDGHRIANLRYDAAIGGGVVAYTAFDEEGRLGLHRLHLDVRDGVPHAGEERTLIRELDAFDGGRATTVGGYDVDADGSVVVAHETLRWEDPIPVEDLEAHVEIHEADFDAASDLPGLPDDGYVYRRDAAIYRFGARGTPEALVRAGTPTDEGHVILGGFGPALQRGRELLFSAGLEYAHPDADVQDVGDGVWYVADLRRGAASARLVQRAGILPTAAFDTDRLSVDGVVGGFGLLDLQPGGRYALQAFAGDPNLPDDDGTTAEFAGSVLLAGTASRVGSARVLSAPRRSGLAPSRDRDAIGIADLASGPRVAADGTVGSVAQFEDGSQRVYVGGRLFAASGDVSPAGHVLESFLPPVFGPQGETYVVAGSESAMELLAFDGRSVRTLLATDDTLVGDPRALSMMTLGTLIHHVDRDGTLAFTALLDDGSSALVIGVPT